MKTEPVTNDNGDVTVELRKDGILCGRVFLDVAGNLATIYGQKGNEVDSMVVATTENRDPLTIPEPPTAYAGGAIIPLEDNFEVEVEIYDDMLVVRLNCNYPEGPPELLDFIYCTLDFLLH